MSTKRAAILLMALVGVACGGGDEADPAAGAAVAQSGDASLELPVVEQEAQADSVERNNDVRLTRETFSYSGGTRDPFSSLFNLASTGPEIQDLELVGIYIDPDHPGNNVALLRERTTGRPHNLRTGDQLGRARVTQIRRMDIVFTIEDFGFERQETISLPKREGGTP